MDPHGYMQITDRSKDVIKSGGEWISSIDLENLAVGHPKVAEAAVIGVKHPKWDERPLLIIVLKKDQAATKQDILGFMEGKIAKWWMPDDVTFVAGNPAHRDRQDPEDRVARAFQGLHIADGGGVILRRCGTPSSKDRLARRCNIVSSILRGCHSASKTRVNALMARTSG